MKIGIVGLGCVGEANKIGFETLGHQVLSHDVKLETKLEDLLEADIVFLCLPTPSTDDGRCDTSVIEGVMGDLERLSYQGLVSIRSTVFPGFTDSLRAKHASMRIAFSPEFLRERCAKDDFLFEHNLLAVGAENEADAQLVEEAHGHLPKNSVRMKPVEAEVLKYFNNVFAAARIVFANVFFEVCEKLGADYGIVKDSYIKTGKAKDLYLDVSAGLRGYGGMCLPKDTKALLKSLDDLGLDFDLIKAIDRDNHKFKTTIFSGMRPGG